jgi:hypothetical protein
MFRAVFKPFVTLNGMKHLLRYTYSLCMAEKILRYAQNDKRKKLLY